MDNEHDKLAVRLSIIVSRLFHGDRLSLTELEAEFNVSNRTLRRDIYQRLGHLDIESNNGYLHLARHHLNARTDHDIRQFARLLHIDTVFPSLDSKLLSLLLDGDHPSPYRIYFPYTTKQPTLFGDFARLSAAIIHQNPVTLITHDGEQLTVEPYRLLLCPDGRWYLAGTREGKIYVANSELFHHVQIKPEHFVQQEQLLHLIEGNDFLNVLPHMPVIQKMTDIGILDTE